MCAMGPEAALLSARLADYRVTKVRGEFGSACRDPMCVAAAVQMHWEDAARGGRYLPRPGVRARLRLALRLFPGRTRPRAEPALPISAAPIAELKEFDRAAERDEDTVSIAFLPLRRESVR